MGDLSITQPFFYPEYIYFLSRCPSVSFLAKQDTSSPLIHRSTACYSLSRVSNFYSSSNLVSYSPYDWTYALESATFRQSRLYVSRESGKSDFLVGNQSRASRFDTVLLYNTSRLV
jgi:hypothetical protein